MTTRNRGRIAGQWKTTAMICVTTLLLIGGICVGGILYAKSIPAVPGKVAAAEVAGTSEVVKKPVKKADAAVARDLEKLKGTWKVVDWQYRGGRTFRGGIGRKYVFDGNSLKTYRNGSRSPSEFQIVIDPSSTPKTMNIVADQFSITRPAIYRFQDGKLIICQGSIDARFSASKDGIRKDSVNNERPKEFQPRGKWNLITLEREK